MQFETTATTNQCNDKDKATLLIVALQVGALGFLDGLPEDQWQDFIAVMK